ncbi:exopolyphosphatase [Aneurinibacillus sp. Ricciae_BoGa-3]|uniref:exopolyphosphatase n=1 Tax=Aneurinibacillus sp. Ricciae_BoGa-3 TaxID=3022697 RepID=UPI002340424E|nr:exopolyphosphatase [Aneurinibacillus sp. Ricciae_BoGa-3]WCK53672.1 exopolyphosphatase [Aneurinibacillus sp. Ricciae_BoGa-3]
MDKYYAVIDMGSNSVRLVIYYREDDRVSTEVDNLKSTIRLSDYLDEDLNISEKGMAIAIRTLQQFRQLCEARNVTDVIGVATAAVRRAKNKEDFLRRVQQETGFTFRLLSGEEEAYYGYFAVVNTMPVNDCITIDIGGGSTEVVEIKDRKLLNSHSFPFGAVTLTRQFFRQGVPTQVEMQSLETYLRKQFDTKGWLKSAGIRLIGMGGTARNLGKIHQKMSGYPFPSLHGYEMSQQQVRDVFAAISPLPLSRIKAAEGMSEERADIIVAGIAIIKVLLEYAGCNEFIISSKGLRDGIWMEKQMGRHGKQLLDDIVPYHMQSFIRSYRVNEAQASHVSALASSLFEQAAELGLLKYNEQEKQLLCIAAQLHDIGHTISFRESYRHTFYLLVHVLLPGLTQKERLLAALLASYKGTKKMRQLALPYKSLLTEKDFQTIERLGLLLLMAYALDRTATQQVSSARFVRKDNGITLLCRGRGEQPLEKDTIEEYKKKFKKQFDRPLSIEWAASATI